MPRPLSSQSTTKRVQRSPTNTFPPLSIGLDLRGNTYWQFLDQRHDKSIPDAALRWRRIVQYPRSAHYSDVKVPPQWHQWLRHQREEPPSLDEQAADVVRQEQMKMLAAEADARWEAKPSLTDMPGGSGKSQPMPALNTDKTQPHIQAAEERQVHKGLRDGEGSKTDIKDDPWKKAARGPSEDWQPAAWTPRDTRKR